MIARGFRRVASRVLAPTAIALAMEASASVPPGAAGFRRG